MVIELLIIKSYIDVGDIPFSGSLLCEHNNWDKITRHKTQQLIGVIHGDGEDYTQCRI